MWGQAPAPGFNGLEIRVQAQNPVAGALVILRTFMDHFEIYKKNANRFRNVLSFDCLLKKVLIFHRTLRYTSGDPLGVCLRNNHRHDASLKTGVDVVKQKEDKVATPAPKAVASWKDQANGRG